MMASFAGKNPPWARAASSSVNSGMNVAGQQVAQVAAQNQVLGQQTVFTIASSQQAVAPQYTAGQVAVNPLAQPGIAIPTTLGTSQVGTVSYPAPRPVAPGGPQAPGAPGSTKQRVFTGTVTKLHDNFGFVDDDVFFQISRCVKGQQPRVGDRVLVEASYNSNMPFKWNATRIQVMPSGAAGAIGGPQAQPQTVAYGKSAFGQGGITPANVPPPNITPTMLSGPPPNVHPPPLMGSGAITGATSGFGNQQGSRFGGGRIEAGRESGRDRRDRNRDRRSPSRRQRSPVAPRRRSRSPKERRTSPRRSRSPLRKKPALVIRRYNVQVPKINLDLKDASVTTLKGRYSNMYIPSDFFNASFLWTDAFPLYRPFSLGHYCSFHVMHKEVEPLNSTETVLEPSDADHLFSAKVMLLSCPILEDLHHKACALAEDPQETQEAFQHPTRLIQFLVGMKGKSEPMAIGGPWSPSLDGKNPEEDPRVLINTAIRTTRALTGIDLSGCTQWYRFAEIRYHRPEETHKGRTLPARVETVVLFLPDVWSCQPSQIEWETLQFGYKKLLSNKMAADKDDSQEEEMETDGTPTKADPTHYSELDPKNMKVSDLRRELEARTLSSKGLKSQLIARLTKATKSEQEKEEEKEAERKEAEEAEVEEIKEDEEAKKEKEEAERLAKEEEEKKKKEERDRAILERHYTLPPNPAIIVHPSATAKSGKFDCTVMNLSVLLDYRPEDTKEHSFEVSLFAELFNEMLMRDFGFQIYRSLVFAPEKKEEPRKEKEKDKEDKESKKEDKDKKEDSEEPAAKKPKTDEKTDAKSKKDEKKDSEKPKDDIRSNSKDKEDDDKKKDKDRDKKRDRDERRKEKVKQYTADPALLLAFVYFDQNHTGYVLDKDCEEILHMLGLHLTRSQVKKLVQKMVSRDTLTYRKLTDKPLPTKEGEEGDKKDTKKDDVKGKKEEPKGKVQEVKAIPEVKAQPVPDEKLAQGNKTLLPQKEETAKSGTPRKRAAKEEEGEVGASGLVQYNGAMVDINNIMSKVESSEQTRNKLEAKMKEQQEELDELRKSYNTSEASGQRVAAELSRLQKKLQEQTDKKNYAEKHAEEMLRAVLAARGQLEQVTEKLNEVIPKPKTEVKEEPTEEASTTVKKEEPAENGAQ